MHKKTIMISIVYCCALVGLSLEGNIHYYGDEQDGAVYNFDHAFADVRGKPTFIDRTRFINHFYAKKELMVIHAPPHFGKTSNLKMLQMFFEIPVDHFGTVLQNYVLEKRQFFDVLRSCRDMDSFFCADKISSHPVIFLDLMKLETEDLESFCVSFRLMISEMFRHHEYLAHSPHLSKEERDMFDKDLHPHGHPLLRDGTYAEGGLHLASLLHKHHNLSCMVLIDNYDAPAAKLIVEGSKDDSISQIVKILSDLMTGLLKDNKFLSHSLLTGASLLGRTYTEHASNLKYYSIFENATLSEFYGLKFKDVEDLMGRFGRQAWLEEARRLYEGYQSLATNETMLAFHSFSKFIENGGSAKDYTPIPILLQLKDLFRYNRLGDTIEKMLERKTIMYRQFSMFNYCDIKNLHRLVAKPRDQLIWLTFQLDDLMLQFLQENGCYTIIRKNDSLCKTDLVVPNLEIKKLLQRLLYTEDFFVEKYLLTRENMKHYVDSVVKLENTEKSFRSLLSSIRMLFKKVAPQTEPEFRAPLYSLPTLLSNESFLRVENEVLGPNSTTIDTLIVRKDNTLIIFDFRFDRDSAFVALSDIVNKKKHEVKTVEKPKNTILVGLHFSTRRDCSVSYLFNTFSTEKAVRFTEKTQ